MLNFVIKKRHRWEQRAGSCTSPCCAILNHSSQAPKATFKPSVVWPSSSSLLRREPQTSCSTPLHELTHTGAPPHDAHRHRNESRGAFQKSRRDSKSVKSTRQKCACVYTHTPRTRATAENYMEQDTKLVMAEKLGGGLNQTVA